MATNLAVDEEIDANVDTEGMGTAPPTDEQNDTSDTGNGQSGISRTTRLLNLGRLLLHLACLGYSFYLIWLVAYLKDNNNYWFLSFIPIICNFLPFLLLLCKAFHGNDIKESTILIYDPSCGVVVNLMACFTMLTRQAYYHRQPDEFIGPRFIILSLQASIILILMDFFLQIVGKPDSLLDHYKDALSRMLLDFVDIFNMVEILSLNVCVGVGSYVSEESSTEKAIQTFCTISFMIVLYGPNPMIGILRDEELKNVFGFTVEQHSPRAYGEILYSMKTFFSCVHQNLPFLVIRIVVWAQYKLYSLGFLVKNVTVIVLFIAMLVKNRHKLTSWYVRLIVLTFNRQKENLDGIRP